MSSSTSSSESAFRPALLWLCALLAALLLAAHLAGRLNRPSALAPPADKLEKSDRFISLFGNSRTRAAVDLGVLTATLSAAGAPVDGQVFSGGGWDAVHFYMLSILQEGHLRPGRDLVIMEVSPLSMNDADSDNRVTAVRPQAAGEIAALPGAPLELRLDVALGAVAGLYRSRFAIQTRILWPRLERAFTRVTAALEAMGLVRPGPAPRFELVHTPGRDLVVDGVKGDLAAFDAINHAKLEALLSAARFGGYKLEATRRAVHRLRARGIDVVLLRVPSSRWFLQRLARTEGARFDEELRALAAAEGAHYLSDWPEDLRRDDRFWDETHMRGSATPDFTRALAAKLAGTWLAGRD